MVKIAVNGNTAHETLLVSKNNLKDCFISNSSGEINISYLITDIKEQLGGNALNISYNLALLGIRPKLFSAVGNDFIFPKFFEEYIDLSSVYYSKKNKTAKIFISTDKQKSNINAFYLGAILDSDKIVCNVSEKFDYAIVSTNSIDSMLEKLEAFHLSGTKVFFDPGSQIIQMNKSQILKAFKLADYLIVNKNEFEVIKKISELTDSEIIESFEKIIITYGLKGSKIFDRNYYLDEIEGVENQNEIDSTGCSDAYRAGLIYGLTKKYSWKSSARLGAILASICAGYVGSQNHKINNEQLEKLYKDTFGEEIE